MDVTITRLKPLIDEVRILRAELSRFADLFELWLQQTHGLTTRIITARKEDLAETRVDYAESEFAEAVEAMERQAGRKFDEEEVQKLYELFKQE